MAVTLKLNNELPKPSSDSSLVFPKSTTLTKVGQAAWEGLKATAVTLGTLFTGLIVGGKYGLLPPQDPVPSCYAGSALVGAAAAAKVYHSLRQKEKEPVQSKNDPSIQPHSLTSLSKAAKSLGDGWAVYASTLAVSISSAIAADARIEDVLGAFLGVSALLGAGKAARTTYSLTQKKTNEALPAAPTPSDYTLSKAAHSLWVGLNVYAYSLLAAAMLGSSTRDHLPPSYAAGPALVGASLALRNFIQKKAGSIDPCRIEQCIYHIHAPCISSGFVAHFS